MPPSLVATIIAPCGGRRRIRHYTVTPPAIDGVALASAALGIGADVGQVTFALGGVQIRPDAFLQAVVDPGTDARVNGTAVPASVADAIAEIQRELSLVPSGEVAAMFIDIVE